MSAWGRVSWKRRVKEWGCVLKKYSRAAGERSHVKKVEDMSDAQLEPDT